jgi:UDP-N-acetylmuramate dehydrogenase
MTVMMNPATLSSLGETYGDRLQTRVPLASYTSARIGGLADALLFVRSADELVDAAARLWQMNIPFILLGGGSNVLVSDRGVRGVVLLNRARAVVIDAQSESPVIRAESGATLNDLAQRAARSSLTGLEWAASIPGSLGGAVYGNAGAFGGEMAANLISVDVLHRDRGRETWPVGRMGYGYRTSVLKRQKQPVLILSAVLGLAKGNTEAIQAIMSRNSEQRRKTQPPGASMGSMFKNPPNDKAGRLIEAAGLKGTRIGSAVISPVHANFFINTDQTRAADMKALLDLAQRTVYEKFGVMLEAEIETIGDW